MSRPYLINPDCRRRRFLGELMSRPGQPLLFARRAYPVTVNIFRGPRFRREYIKVGETTTETWITYVGGNTL